MAINDLTLQLIIKAVDLATQDIDGVHDKLEDLKKVLLGNEFDRSAEGMRSFGEAVKDSTAPLAEAAKNTLALSAAVTGVAGYLASNAYNAAKDYESALADLAKVLDGGKEEAQAYGEELNKLAMQYGQNGQEFDGSHAPAWEPACWMPRHLRTMAFPRWSVGTINDKNKKMLERGNDKNQKMLERGNDKN